MTAALRIPLRLVIDTNVVLDLYHFQRPTVAPITQMIANGEALCFTCPRTLEELRHVLPREHFRLDEAGQAALLDRYTAQSLCARDPESALDLPACKDTSDQKFLQLAASVAADYLLTRDKALLRLAKRVRKKRALTLTTPERFLADQALFTTSANKASTICAPSA